ncbi:uncharacterized protein [Notamacropus eugenii]|uniref:uncharacterized protein n=1 Tax=Notamacropus eugenii TaxID=9315 RepID=UPI003B66E0E3
MVSWPVFSILIISMSGLLYLSPADASPASCCFSYVTRLIPRKFVVDYDYTSQECFNPAVIFTTSRGFKICADPQKQWVKQYVANLKQGRFRGGSRLKLQSCQNKHTGNSGSDPESTPLPPLRTMVSLVFLSILIILVPGFCFETTKYATHYVPNACCHSYTRRRIQYSLLVDFYETSSLCLKPGIIFLTNKGHQICANPKSEWVQEYIFRLKEKKKTEEYDSQRKHFYESIELSSLEE